MRSPPAYTVETSAASDAGAPLTRTPDAVVGDRPPSPDGPEEDEVDAVDEEGPVGAGDGEVQAESATAPAAVTASAPVIAGTRTRRRTWQGLATDV